MRRLRNIPEGQDPLPFRGERRGILSYALPWERRMVAALGLTLLVLSVLYVYFVMASIVHVAARQELMGKIATAQTSVSRLETAYLSKTEGLTESYARSLGFVSAPKEIFVEKSAVAFGNPH